LCDNVTQAYGGLPGPALAGLKPGATLAGPWSTHK
jgi:hypothetical protein